jgi:hypothetical protein
MYFAFSVVRTISAMTSSNLTCPEREWQSDWPADGARERRLGFAESLVYVHTMKRPSTVRAPRGGLLIAFAATLLLLGGCASKPKVDWDARVGTYTCDDAIKELGPPERFTELGDGSAVGEWFVKRNPTFSFGMGTGTYGYHGGVGVGQTVTTGGSGQYLRLTFDQDRKLSRWEKVNR